MPVSILRALCTTPFPPIPQVIIIPFLVSLCESNFSSYTILFLIAAGSVRK